MPKETKKQIVDEGNKQTERKVTNRKGKINPKEKKQIPRRVKKKKVKNMLHKYKEKIWHKEKKGH